jgi:hypothetical protein
MVDITLLSLLMSIWIFVLFYESNDFMRISHVAIVFYIIVLISSHNYLVFNYITLSLIFTVYT